MANIVYNSLKKWLKAAGLPEDLHLHSIRHTSISLAANQPNANLRAIQQLSGHSTIAMVEKYVHGFSEGTISLGDDY